ncbi:icd-like protein, partial [Escherichia coli]|nr:icd-like protein [Escherichia coli]MEA0468352.1 icd-like protein [Escherichia coli]
MKTGYTPEQGRGFVRPGETEKQQNRGFSGIKKAAPIRSRLSEQFTCCAKNEYEQGNYINRVAKRHNCRITGKEKATCHGGQCDQCAGLLVGYSCSLALRRWSSSRATATSCPISSAALTPIFSTCASASSEETRGFSPLPSAWRRA